MKKSRKNLLESFFDVIVIGGGIVGAAVARDAVLRGMNILLVEKRDFSSGTSSRSGKLIHGGLRYLRYGHFKLVYESCRERYFLWKILAPHLVKKVRFFYPFYKYSRTPRWLAAIGTFLYSLIALSRNIGWPSLVSSSQIHKLIPMLKLDFLCGALSYCDCQVSDVRLVIDTLKSAEEKGAALANYLEVRRIENQDGIFTLDVVDHLNGQFEYQIRTRSVINATGIWVDNLLNLEGSDLDHKVNYNLKKSSGVHLTVSKTRFPLNEVVTLEARSDFRNIYCIPWGEYVLIGCTDLNYSGELDEPKAKLAEINYLLDTLAFYFPILGLTNQDIISVTCGIRPLIGSDKGKLEKDISRDYEIKISASGIISITGGKLTTHRVMAKKTVDLLISKFFKKRKKHRCTTMSPISGGDKIDIAALSEKELVIYTRYGSNLHNVLKYQKNNGDLIPTLPYYWFEIDYMVAHEFVEHLSDLLIRRTDIFLMRLELDDDLLMSLVNYLGALKNWDRTKCLQEVREYQQFVMNIKKYRLKSFEGNL